MEPLRCQHCHSVLTRTDETLDQDPSCPTCGSRLSSRPGLLASAIGCNSRMDQFELLGIIGKGQFGTVWRARDTLLDRIVALKVPRQELLDEHTRKMFLREGTAAAALSHPNIVRVHEVAESSGRIYLVSEFIHGDDLKICLGNNAFPTVDEVLRFIIPTADALHHAHQRGIVHRDLKPGNIIVDDFDQPHLTDFGLAKIEWHDATMTVTGSQPVGTVSYMSPEQAAGEIHKLDYRSDIFSLGVILYEMLTRVRPFPGLTVDEILSRVQKADPQDPRQVKPDLPADVCTVCLKALSRSPERRYQTAWDMAEDLRRCQAGTPIVARPISRLEKSVRWIRRNVTLAAICCVALLSMGVAATTLLQAAPGTQRVEFTTLPEGAEVEFFPLDPVSAQPLLDQIVRAGRSPVRLRLPAANYLVVTRLDDGRFHEVYRHVPIESQRVPEIYPHRNWTVDRRGTVHLPVVVIPQHNVTEGMVKFQGGGQTRPFVLDPHEVTIQEFRKAFGELPGGLGPVKPESDMLPMTDTLFDYMVWYAEIIGKRLPTESEYEFALTNGGTTRYPWGNDERELPSDLMPVASLDVDQTLTNPAVHGLLSNGPEFTGTPYALQPGRPLSIPGMPAPPTGQESLQSPAVPLFEYVTVRGGNPVAVRSRSADPQAPSLLLRSGLARRQLSERIGFRTARSLNRAGT